MDENRPPYRLQAPGAATSRTEVRLPARGRLPHVDDHLDPPVVTRWERIDGRRVEASPADGPHAIRHGDLDYVVRGKVAPGYRIASDLKTRFEMESDFASDTAVLKEGKDPATGRRYLEEIVFEVVSTQSLKDVTVKAPKMIRRGVRRVFAVFLRKHKVCEWSAARGVWTELDPSSAIEDPCLIEPLEVRALFDVAAADDAVARGLVARGNPVIERIQQERVLQTKAAVLERLLRRRFGDLDSRVERRLSEATAEELDAWSDRILDAERLEDVFAEAGA